MFNDDRAIIKSVERILAKENPGQILSKDLTDWYQELFNPSVQAGLIRPADLAGYRSNLVTNESEASVRVVLGHFFLGSIHPFMDGNGRIARFLMNTMLASGGYPWTVIRVEDRAAYMQALEAASSENGIEPFARFIGEQIGRG